MRVEERSRKSNTGSTMKENVKRREREDVSLVKVGGESLIVLHG